MLTSARDPAPSREIMEVLHFWLIQHTKVDIHYELVLESALVREVNHRSPQTP